MLNSVLVVYCVMNGPLWPALIFAWLAFEFSRVAWLRFSKKEIR